MNHRLYYIREKGKDEVFLITPFNLKFVAMCSTKPLVLESIYNIYSVVAPPNLYGEHNATKR
jgi:hypothetical protein